MYRIYLVYGLVVCMLVIYANHRGWRPVNDLLFAKTWDPREPAAATGGFHHK